MMYYVSAVQNSKGHSSHYLPARSDAMGYQRIVNSFSHSVVFPVLTIAAVLGSSSSL